jgi:hypothetical protein
MVNILKGMASMPSKAQMVKFFVNFALSHSKMAPNSTLLVGVVVPYVK